jgi:hypothetical protein
MDYKIVNAKQLEADLASVADSIRAKSGTSDKLAFPDGFKSAVDGISAGGSGGSMFTTKASGVITSTLNGRANSTFTIDFESGASGYVLS